MARSADAMRTERARILEREAACGRRLLRERREYNRGLRRLRAGANTCPNLKGEKDLEKAKEISMKIRGFLTAEPYTIHVIQGVTITLNNIESECHEYYTVCKWMLTNMATLNSMRKTGRFTLSDSDKQEFLKCVHIMLDETDKPEWGQFVSQVLCEPDQWYDEEADDCKILNLLVKKYWREEDDSSSPKHRGLIDRVSAAVSSTTKLSIALIQRICTCFLKIYTTHSQSIRKIVFDLWEEFSPYFLPVRSHVGQLNKAILEFYKFYMDRMRCALATKKGFLLDLIMKELQGQRTYLKSIDRSWIVSVLVVCTLVYLFMNGEVITMMAECISPIIYAYYSVEQVLVIGASSKDMESNKFCLNMESITYLLRIVLHIMFGHQYIMDSLLAHPNLLYIAASMLYMRCRVMWSSTPWK